MATIGNRPTDKLLTTNDIADGAITSADLNTGAVTFAKLDISAVLGGKLQSITNTLSAGGLTFALNSTTLDFRPTTLTSGIPSPVTLSTQSTLALTTGITLGSVSGIQSRIAQLAINNAGTIESAISNLAGGNSLDETGLITTIPIAQQSTFTGSIAVTTGVLTISATGTGTFALGQALSGTGVTQGTYVIALLSGTLGVAASTYSTNTIVAVASTVMTGVAGIGIYSTTARTNVAYRVVGFVDAVNTTGAWATPVLVQGTGGQALAALSSAGYGQTWQDVTVSRVSGTTYYNTTGKQITVSARSTEGINATTSTQITVGGVVVALQRMYGQASGVTTGTMNASADVLPGQPYIITCLPAIAFVSEKR